MTATSELYMENLKMPTSIKVGLGDFLDSAGPSRLSLLHISLAHGLRNHLSRSGRCSSRKVAGDCRHGAGPGRLFSFLLSHGGRERHLGLC